MKIVVLTGAGMSAESGLKTFRDADGLWEGHDVMKVASPQGWYNDPELVLDFYNQRRSQLLQVEPNIAHKALAEMESEFETVVITQNVDDLHERAGSSRVVHLHGELFKVRCTQDETDIQIWKKDLVIGDVSNIGQQLRPHIVWFGESVPLMDLAISHVQEAAVVIIIGTSMQVYPAAGLMQYAPTSSKVYFVDPNPSISSSEKVKVYAEKATIGVPKVILELKNN